MKKREVHKERSVGRKVHAYYTYYIENTNKKNQFAIQNPIL